MEVMVSVDVYGGEWCVGGGYGVGGRSRRSARASSTAWEVSNVWLMGVENVDWVLVRFGEVSDCV